MSNPLIVIQARTGSARLPGKALLPIRGIATAVLAAKRAANQGHQVVVATSVEPSDDALCETLAEAGVPAARGPLNNVLERFLEVTRDMDDNDWIIRLTGDNVFPDGSFIAELLEAARQSESPYLGTHSPFDGLPYGMSAEAVTAGALRSVAPGADAAEKEHVTLGVRRRISSARFQPRDFPSMNHLRCTMDTFDDYTRLQEVFARVEDPVREPWKELCCILDSLDSTPDFRIPFSEHNGAPRGRMTLGTAQLGLPHYGIANQDGRPDPDAARRIVACAIDHGVTAIDCAQAYGEAEERLGEILDGGLESQCEVYTKLDPLTDLGPDAGPGEVRARVDASISQSRRNLRRETIDTLLLHRWEHYSAWSGAVWSRLLELRESGVIKALGASVSTVREAVAAMDEPCIKRMQIPMNILDWRWRDEAFLKAVQARQDVEIDVRSAYLQGLLLSDPDRWPRSNELDAGTFTSGLDKLVGTLNRSDRDDLCLAYVAAQSFVTSIVVGVETEAQLQANLALMTNPCLTDDEVAVADQALPHAPEWLLNPAEWPNN